MTLRSVHNIIHPQPRPMGPLTMHQPLPAAGLNQIDPFLLLHHHGPQVFPAHNDGLPFSPHPHRGFETVTFIYEGDVQHRDSSGFASTIQKGGVQWMTTGSGLVHAEESSVEFLELGGPVELIQLWTNLPARHKMVKPTYTGLQASDIPLVSINQGSIAAVSGEWNGIQGPIKPLIDLSLSTISLQKGGSFIREIPAEYNILFYLLNGSITVNGTPVSNRSLVQFANDGDEIRVEALGDARILLGFAEPLNEPVVAHGPFVMNTYEEIQQAITDYQSGKMGVL